MPESESTTRLSSSIFCRAATVPPNEYPTPDSIRRSQVCEDDAVSSAGLFGRMRRPRRRVVWLILLGVGLAGCGMAGGSSWSWTARRQVTGGGFDSLSCPTATECIGLVGYGQMVRLEGTTWTRPVAVEQVGKSNAPYTLTCVSATRCFAVDGLGRILTYNGKQWSRPVEVDPVSTGGIISNISCASADFCAVGDSNGDASFFDGDGWSKLAPVADSGGVAEISCPAVGLCFAVDAESDEAFRYANGRWSISAELDLSTPQGGSEPNALNAISCGSPTFCVALDTFGEAFTFNGKWSGARSFDDIENADDEVSCSGSTTCAIVDDSNNVVVDDGGAWSSPHHLDAPHTSLQDVSCAPAQRCIAVDGSGGYFIGRRPTRT
jgi:hypothetical protein